MFSQISVVKLVDEKRCGNWHRSGGGLGFQGFGLSHLNESPYGLLETVPIGGIEILASAGVKLF